uniref:Uncharacterized protein n=1 Tax=Rhodopseudomonas palustris (strain BisA53) TaxID=316055 RepID=Q07NE2_RHOP5
MTFSNIDSAARAAALKLYALSSSMGQSGGQIAFGLGQLDFGKVPTLLAGAGVIFALGVARARLLQGTPTIVELRSDAAIARKSDSDAAAAARNS